MRRLEAKFDAKSIWSEAITVRCSQPPSQRKVPIQFDGWVLLAESSRDENIFRSCQLIQDRPWLVRRANISIYFYICLGMRSVLNRRPKAISVHPILSPCLQVQQTRGRLAGGSKLHSSSCQQGYGTTCIGRNEAPWIYLSFYHGNGYMMFSV